jgi:hypothetical protein
MKFLKKFPFRLVALIANIGISITSVGCANSVNLKYFVYEGDLAVQKNENCLECNLSAFSQGESSLTLKFGSGEERLTVSAYDATGFGGHFYISGWFEIQNKANESHLRTNEGSVSFAIECSGKKNLSLIPNEIELIDFASGHAIALKNFTEYSPGSILPSKTTAQRWILLDRSDYFECRKNEVRTFVAKFDFEPSMKMLQFNFAKSLFFDGKYLLSPSVRFTLAPREQFLYQELQSPFPFWHE